MSGSGLDQNDLQAQIKVSKALSIGFVFSLVWLAGLGSLTSLIIGIWAKRGIDRSDGKLAGSGLAWWCIIAGAIGVVVLPILLLDLFN